MSRFSAYRKKHPIICDVFIITLAASTIGGITWLRIGFNDGVESFAMVFVLLCLSFFVGKKFDNFMVALILIVLGFSMINAVLDDFIKTIKISAGLFFVSAGIDEMLGVFGSSHSALLKKIKTFLLTKKRADELSDEDNKSPKNKNSE